MTDKLEKSIKGGGSAAPSCYIISVSYGNDSIALIQWAHEKGLENCFVVYCDTGWSHPDWQDRVSVGADLAESYGFITWTVRAKYTFKDLVIWKKMFPTNKFNWCSPLLKYEPFSDFVDFLDPDKKMIIIIGKRRGESNARANTEEFIADKRYYDGRIIWHPLYKHSEYLRNSLVLNAGFDVLSHRSMECCPCINANRSDLIHTPDEQITKVEELERLTGAKMFDPKKHMGAVGIGEILRWATSDRAKYHEKQFLLWNHRGEFCETGICGI